MWCDPLFQDVAATVDQHVAFVTDAPFDIDDVLEGFAALKKASHRAVDCAGLLDQRQGGADSAPAKVASQRETGDKIKKGIMIAAKENNRARMKERIANDAPLKPPVLSKSTTPTSDDKPSPSSSEDKLSTPSADQPTPSASASTSQNAGLGGHRRSASNKKLGARSKKNRSVDSDDEDDAAQSTFASVAKSHLRTSFGKLEERIEKIK